MNERIFITCVLVLFYAHTKPMENDEEEPQNGLCFYVDQRAQREIKIDELIEKVIESSFSDNKQLLIKQLENLSPEFYNNCLSNLNIDSFSSKKVSLEQFLFELVNQINRQRITDTIAANKQRKNWKRAFLSLCGICAVTGIVFVLVSFIQSGDDSCAMGTPTNKTFFN